MMFASINNANGALLSMNKLLMILLSLVLFSCAERHAYKIGVSQRGYMARETERGTEDVHLSL